MKPETCSPKTKLWFTSATDLNLGNTLSLSASKLLRVGLPVSNTKPPRKKVSLFIIWVWQSNQPQRISNLNLGDKFLSGKLDGYLLNIKNPKLKLHPVAVVIRVLPGQKCILRKMVICLDKWSKWFFKSTTPSVQLICLISESELGTLSRWSLREPQQQIKAVSFQNQSTGSLLGIQLKYNFFEFRETMPFMKLLIWVRREKLSQLVLANCYLINTIWQWLAFTIFLAIAAQIRWAAVSQL